MDVEAGIKGRLSDRHVTEAQTRAPGRSGSFGARWIDSLNSARLAIIVDRARILTKVGQPSDVNLIYARCSDRKTEWRIGATNPTSGERPKYARQFGQMYSGALTYSGGMFEKLRYADG